MRRPTMLRTAALGLALAGMVPAAAQAYPVHRRLFRSTYGVAAGCQLCHGHGGGTERNPYGAAWQKLGETTQAFRALDGKDSDGDGAANAEEIKAGSNPGDKASTPGAPGAGLAAKPHALLPMDQLPMLFRDVDSYEVSEPDLSAEQVKALEGIAGRALEPEERYPTLYFAVRGQKRVGLASFAYARLGTRRVSLLVGLGPDGKIAKALIFRVESEKLEDYRRYLDQVAGKGRGEILKALEATAAPSPEAAKARRTIGQAIELVLGTAAVLFSKA